MLWTLPSKSSNSPTTCDQLLPPAAVRLQKIKERFGDRVSIRWHPFALQLADLLFRFQGSYVEGAWRRISAMVASEGLEYRMWDKDEFPRWSMPGLEAGIAAQRQGEDAFHRFHLGLYRSFFTESKSLIDKDNLVAVARDAGLDMNTFMHIAVTIMSCKNLYVNNARKRPRPISSRPYQQSLLVASGDALAWYREGICKIWQYSA